MGPGWRLHALAKGVEYIKGSQIDGHADLLPGGPPRGRAEPNEQARTPVSAMTALVRRGCIPAGATAPVRRTDAGRPWMLRPGSYASQVDRPEADFQAGKPLVSVVLERGDLATQHQSIRICLRRRQGFRPDPDDHCLTLIRGKRLRHRLIPRQDEALAAEVDDDLLAGNHRGSGPRQVSGWRAEEPGYKGGGRIAVHAVGRADGLHYSVAQHVAPVG